MRRLYSLLVYCAVLPLLLHLLWRSRVEPAYRRRWRERLGLYGVPPTRCNGVVLHCASVGEAIAARPLIAQLLAGQQWGPLTLTCTTPTGSRLIRQEYGDRVGHQYFPFDLPGATRRFLHSWRPRLVILFERELWPNFLHQSQALGVPVVLVNARLSRSSAATYGRWHWLLTPALVTLRLVCAEDAPTASRFAALGVHPARLRVTGNIKSDLRLDPALPQRIARVRQSFAQRPVLTAGSTHGGEDEALIAAFADHLVQSPQSLLILVPRHPERFAVVAGLLERSGLRFARHSLGQTAQVDTQVLLGDTMGELMLWYGVADACLVGGSLVPRGGHNPLEVLCLDKPLIAGPHTANFEQIYAALLACGGMLPAPDARAVFDRFASLLHDRDSASELTARGRAVYLRLAGATAATVAHLKPFAAHARSHADEEPVPMRHGRELIWAEPDCFAAPGPRLFDLAWWRQHGAVTSAGAGRGEIHWVEDHQRAYLLRHYHRGGMMAKLSSDLYLAQPLAQSRVMREFNLLRSLRRRGLAVPQPCAARYSRHWFFYRADILLERIADASDVAKILHTRRALARHEWNVLGRSVRALHEEQVFHADLNCHNLMLDGSGTAWLVDFDKCGFRAGEKWKQHNLQRLLRSLRKERRLNPDFRWNEADWQHFLDGYGLAPA